MLISLFDKKINLLDNYCSLNGRKAHPIKTPYVNLYVRLTGYCNASCPFCIYKDEASFNFNKFTDVLKELEKTVEINKVSFTGGEPSSSPYLLKNAIARVKSTSRQTFIVVNTNGFRLREIAALDIDSVALSRHHYDDNKNNTMFKAAMLTSEDIKSLKLDNIHLSCNLIKGQIDSVREVGKYLAYAATLGVKDVGFVSLIPVNKYCKDNFVDFKDVVKKDTKYIKKYKQWKKEDTCRCNNYLFIQKGELIPFYNRHVLKPNQHCTNTLVFDGNYLRKGFTKDIIY